MNTEKTLQIKSISSAHTEQIGEQIGSILQSRQVIELESDLGGGKTTFVKGLAKGLGYNGVVSSPTFTLSREYICRSGLKLFHYDFFRLDKAGIMSEELAESISNKDAISIIEWADTVSNILPDNRLKISISIDSNNAEIRIFYLSAKPNLIKKIKQVINK